MELLLLGGALLALLFSALCSASETSYFSLSAFERKKLVQNKPDSGRLRYCLSHLSEILVVILLFNIFVNIAFGFLIENLLHRLLGESALQIALAITLSTVLLIFFGEIIPKSIAFEKRMKIAPRLASWWHGNHHLLGPVLKFLLWVAERLKQGLVLTFVPKSQVDKEHELTHLLALGRRRGSLSLIEKSLLQNISDLHECNAKDLMTPRVAVQMLDTRLAEEEVKQALHTHGYSYYPLFEGFIDELKGVLNAREYLLLGGTLQQHVLKPVFVPETARFFDVMTQFQEKNCPLVLVVDEYGGFTGLITYADLMEEITGDLGSNLNSSETGIKYLGKGRYLIPGNRHLEDIGELFHQELTHHTADTLNGLIQEISGDLPRTGKTYHSDGLNIQVQQVSHKQLILARVWRQQKK